MLYSPNGKSIDHTDGAIGPGYEEGIDDVSRLPLDEIEQRINEGFVIVADG